jgi:predicted Ser/Thr protein kinase
VLLLCGVQGVLHKQWQMQDKQQACASSYLSELQLHSVLGVGGFSTVYAGTWMGARTAIKVRVNRGKGSYS